MNYDFEQDNNNHELSEVAISLMLMTEARLVLACRARPLGHLSPTTGMPGGAQL